MREQPNGDLRTNAFFYLYDLLATSLVFSIAGFVAGRHADHLRRRKAFYHELAEHDSLTGLHNSGAFTDRYRRALERAAAAREPIAIILIDVDQLKAINDTLDAPEEEMIVMKSLQILWQRLVSSDGKTCDRCNSTYQEIQRAVDKLREALHPLGIEPTLEIREIDEQTFKANPSESNRIWIAGKPLEEWVSAKVGSSPCCSVCGESPCRTVELEGTMFEAIPENLLIQAALVASSSLLSPASVT